jgi:transcription elongation factor Elf1
MLVKKQGKTFEFDCPACESVFVAGIHSVKDEGGNYYCQCPVCGAECYTDVTRQTTKRQKMKDGDGNAS